MVQQLLLSPKQEKELFNSNIISWIQYINNLETIAPHGRCYDCEGALTANDAHYGKYHVGCANAKFGDQ